MSVVRFRELLWPLLAMVLVTVQTFPVRAEGGPWFEIAQLNEGLGPAPETLDRSTPRAIVEGLIDWTGQGRADMAAHTLDLGHLDPASQRALGGELAEQLATLIARKVKIDWSDVLDRPDGLDATASSKIGSAGEPRKSILLWSLSLGDRPVSLRVNRVRPDGGEPVWVFARQTVANIPALYEAFGPSRFEKSLPAELRQETVWGLMLWELVGLPVVLGVAALAGFVVHRALRAISRRVGHPIARDVLRSIRGPGVIGAAITVLWAATSTLFVFSGKIDVFLTPAITIGIVICTLWFCVNAIDAVLDRIADFSDDDLTASREQKNRELVTKVAAVRRGLTVVIVAVGLGITLSGSGLSQTLGLSLIGTAGALTLVLGFAGRRVLGNILSSLQIALNQSARIGDRIVYRDHLCHVERIHFTYIQLREWDGTRLVVPVEEFISEPFENWTMQEPEMLRIVKLQFAHGADVEVLREIFRKVLDELDPEELDDLEKAKVRVAGQDVFGKEVWFAVPCLDPNTSWDVECKAREAILRRAAERETPEGAPIFPEVTPAEAA